MFRPLLNDKIGNLLRYLANEIDGLYLTKALKILYIIDEVSVRQIGVPVTWQDYQVWKLGPVAHEVYAELRNKKQEFYNGEEISLRDYVKIKTIPNPVEPQYGSFILKPIGIFSDDEFTDFEIDLIETIVDGCRYLSSNDLVKKLHQDGTLWHKVVSTKKLKRIFALEQNRSSHIIDFTELTEKDPHKTNAYKSAYEAMSFELELSSSNYA